MPRSRDFVRKARLSEEIKEIQSEVAGGRQK